jgi:hypothetical protein
MWRQNEVPEPKIQIPKWTGAGCSRLLVNIAADVCLNFGTWNLEL